MIVAIDAARITNWETFHDEFVRVFGFPDFYGRNMDAWIDCMTSLDAPEDRLSALTVAPGQVVTLAIDHLDELAARCPEIYEALIDCSGFVNWRRIERRGEPILALSYYKNTRLLTIAQAADNSDGADVR